MILIVYHHFAIGFWIVIVCFQIGYAIYFGLVMAIVIRPPKIYVLDLTRVEWTPSRLSTNLDDHFNSLSIDVVSI